MKDLYHYHRVSARWIGSR